MLLDEWPCINDSPRFLLICSCFKVTVKSQVMLKLRSRPVDRTILRSNFGKTIQLVLGSLPSWNRIGIGSGSCRIGSSYDLSRF